MEARILNASNAFRAREIRGSLIATRLPFTRVVDEKFSDLTERPTLLAVVDDQARSSGLGGADAFLDAMGEIGATRTDIRAENIRAIAFVVDPTGQGSRRIMDGGRIPEDIQRGATYRRQEYVNVATSHQLRIHACRLLEQRTTQ